MSETKLNAESILAGQGVGVSETFGVGAAVVGYSKYVLGLEIYAGVFKEKFLLNFSGQSVAKGQSLQTQE